MKNIKTLKFSLFGMLVIGILLISTSCATLSGPGENTALHVADLVNSGDSTSLKAMSADTLLFDSEILHGPVMIGSLWDGLASSGFMLKNAEIADYSPVETADASLFGNVPDTAVFFSEYIPENSVLFHISSAGGNFLLILGPGSDGASRILAFGGPY